MTLQNISTRIWRNLSIVLLAVLAITHLDVSYASIEPVEYGLINGGFGHHGSTCTLAGWTSVGSTRVESLANGNCFAVVSAAVPSGDGRTVYASSSLEQTFLVDPDYAKIHFYVQPHSNTTTDTLFGAQTISLYNDSGALIYQQSRNLQAAPGQYYFFYFNLSGYVGESVTVRFTTTVGSSKGMPSSVRMHIDMDKADGSPEISPETNPGPGW